MSTKQPIILLVEDEPMIADLYATVLSTRPYRVLRALNKTSALSLIEEHRPHLILLDLMIPIGAGEDLISYDHPVGFDIVEWVHHHPELTGTKIVIITNLESDEHRRHAMQLGVTEYLVKAQYDPHAIAEKVETILEA